MILVIDCNMKLVMLFETYALSTRVSTRRRDALYLSQAEIRWHSSGRSHTGLRQATRYEVRYVGEGLSV
jgi:hypothetical protein